MESEKVKGIKQALENCQKDNCLGCPYFINKKRCRANDLLLDTITLINELEHDNERIKNIGLNEDITVREWLQENKQLKDRIAELEKENKDYYDRLNNLQTYIDNHEEIWKGNTNNALNKFSERLKEKMHKGEYMGDKYKLAVFRDIDIDETLKEFLK